ncbi:MAG: biopolymer transporter ExbD [Thalassolituus maritimus]|jgi:biopolymer transport protein ExbD|uniref:ExbD/TolR family protein n=1 Tax=unclassified Thalassolituus TaxID=2624967 RepID=UPI000B682FD3|nr:MULTISPECIES: biopolymer transporter ExbD [unclassified Thalassolituus]MAE34377.1 biopolymer transporter ExbD [Oceanospirillaceae bacterium]OUX66329.1 MAG: biopolymer transporter ExbD [Oceanospirillaceae bacterium TMED276]TPD55749.1 MAG: biopolymer transporter ExbD [Thalassolituus maritimus]MBN58806.1 biopolymer transporter ExbD [Oceanospirillaceae bacterium]MDQ4423607.1 biopolymer transporter ExbD [Thalassolituus sp.]|tara:strand:+ start:901 stop:1410 length:510 start_codon:yes stop_codon:yes gene_type:complete
MRRHKKIREEAELNVTSFMNLMIVLVPVLLMNMVFSQLAVLDLRLPSGDEPGAVNPEDVTLEVTIRKTGFTLSRTYQEETVELASIPAQSGELDYEGLSEALQKAKKNPEFAEKRDITLLAEPNTDYQTLVTVMDTVRIYPAVVAASLVDAVLFPDISLGEADAQEVAP